MPTDELITVSVTVPSSKVAQLQRFAADLVEGQTTLLPECGTAAANAALQNSGDGARGPHRFKRRLVREAYNGGTSDVWPRFLDAMADHVLNPRGDDDPDEDPGSVWVSLETLREDVGLNSRQMSGMLGAAERRIHDDRLPYDKSVFESDRWYVMKASVAEMIQELSAANRESRP